MKKAIKTLFAMSLLLPSLLFAQQATTNAIYIDQVGDASTITITQKGQNNSIGTEANRLQLQGDAQLLTITQQGGSNSINGLIKQADNIDYTVAVTGDSNSIVYNEGDTASIAGSKSVLTVSGSSNALTFNQADTASATNADQTITIQGDQNTYTSHINADDVVNKMTVAGDQNNLTLTQNGFAGKNVDMTLTGNGNTVTVSQTSTLNVDTLKINSTSSGSTISISQCNAGGTC